MSKIATTVVIGAGPYGLAVSTYLKNGDIPTLTFGKSMALWRNMPEGLCIKSVWSASSLADPEGQYSLDKYLATTGLTRPEPTPLAFFLDYSHWFQEKMVPDLDETYVQSIEQDGSLFRLGLADGREVSAKRVVVATGIADFAYVPDYARDLPPSLAAHTQSHSDLCRFKNQRVVVVGSGQSALEYAALLHEKGAEVEVIARGPFIWHSRILYERTGPARRIFYPPGDVGPPGINWLVSYPMLFSHLPESIKKPVHQRAIRPAGAKWLRPRVEGQLTLTPYTEIEHALPQGDALHLKLSNGEEREIDFLFLATGYKPQVNRLTFIDPVLREQIQTNGGYPKLNSWFESSIPNLHFAGALAGQTFGPVCRFLSGSRIPARQIARRATLVD